MFQVVVVSNELYLRSQGGGVQWCTREYLETLREADVELQTVSYRYSPGILTRLHRKILPKPLAEGSNQRLAARIVDSVRLKSPDFICLNNTEGSSFAPLLRKKFPDARLIFFSHGVETTDVVNNMRIAKEVMPRFQQDSRWLGNLLKTEIRIRENLDGVVCISQEDVAFEKWLGASKVLFIPRQIPAHRIDIEPVRGRVGTVSTLNHGPNLHGLRLFAGGAKNLEIRLVGGPEDVGLELEREFPSIKYLGRLSDAELRTEAVTWNAFVNPIFCQARGASTKVATALGWGMPVLTTRVGARGYLWDEDSLPLADTPKQLVENCELVALGASFGEWQRRAVSIASMAPSAREAGQQLFQFLRDVQTRTEWA